MEKVLTPQEEMQAIGNLLDTAMEYGLELEVIYFALKNHVLWSFTLIIAVSVTNVLTSLFGEPILIACNW